MKNSDYILSLDLKGLNCPIPILKTKKALMPLPEGSIIEVWTTDPASREDLKNFCKHTGHTLLSEEVHSDDSFRFVIQRKYDPKN
jgi:tRNA 2-thiouridine synthesizing protein A